MIAQLIKNPPAIRETLVQFLGLEDGSAGKESACNEGDLGSIPGLGRGPGEGQGYPLQYSGLENSTDCTVHGVTKSRSQLSDFHFQAAGWRVVLTERSLKAGAMWFWGGSDG